MRQGTLFVVTLLFPPPAISCSEPTLLFDTSLPFWWICDLRAGKVPFCWMGREALIREGVAGGSAADDDDIVGPPPFRVVVSEAEGNRGLTPPPTPPFVVVVDSFE